MNEDMETKIWKQYQEGLSYQRKMGFSDKFPLYERFKQGDQWPKATEKTKNLPRPVFNIIRMFVNNKKSNVLNQNIKMIFSPAEVTDEFEADLALQGARDYTDFAANLWQELNQDELNDEIVDDAALNGTGFLHYYWDASAVGGSQNPYVGALRGEAIDALNIFFGNPQDTRIQKQPWIIISSRDRVEQVKKEAKKQGLSQREIDYITPDNDTSAQGYDSAKQEQDGEEKITVLTKYYRNAKGEVCFSKSTRCVTLIRERSLTPQKPEEGPMSGSMGNRQEAKIRYYPIAAFQWYRRKKCIFGTGEVEGILPNQKAINFNIAMLLLSIQDNAWPKMIVKPGALKQNITNMPGEIVTDYYQNGDGVRYMQPPNFNYMAIQLADKVMDLSRSTAGVTEVATGEQLGANMAASAIIALQNQAKVPIENIQKGFYRTIKEVGRIWEQFFKACYTMPRSITTEDGNGNAMTRTFIGDNYKNVEFQLKIDVGAASTYSEALAMSTLDKMYDKGDITVDQYIELAPNNVMPFKEKLKQMRTRDTQRSQIGGNGRGVIPEGFTGKRGGNGIEMRQM